MTPLKDIGYIEKGMILVDRNGTEATVTDVMVFNDSPFENILYIELNDMPKWIPLDWGRLDKNVRVRGTE